MLALQRTAGNRATARYLARLKRDAPPDCWFVNVEKDPEANRLLVKYRVAPPLNPDYEPAPSVLLGVVQPANPKADLARVHVLDESGFHRGGRTVALRVLYLPGSEVSYRDEKGAAALIDEGFSAFNVHVQGVPEWRKKIEWEIWPDQRPTDLICAPGITLGEPTEAPAPEPGTQPKRSGDGGDDASTVQTEEEQAQDLATTITDLTTDFVPGVSNVKDLTTALSGINPVTGQSVGIFGRILALLLAIPLLGNVLKYIGKGGKLLWKGFRWLGRGLKKLGSMMKPWLKIAGRWSQKQAVRVWRWIKSRLKRLRRAKLVTGARAAHWRSTFTAADKQIQSKFVHATDFGIVGNYNKANHSAFKAAVEAHVRNPAHTVIEGVYTRNNLKVVFHVDPKTGLTVIQERATGAFLSGWKLTQQQLHHVLRYGTLGGV